MKYRTLFLFGAVAASLSAQVAAGEEILYGATPEWVEPAELPDTISEPGKILRLVDQQVRLEGGKVWRYQDVAILLNSPQALSAGGTLTAQWLPDKGDITFHRVEIVRGSEVIDVLAGGARFEVLRREEQLEMRMLNGLLTATMAAPGVRVGDVIRMAYSTTVSDQALGEGMEWRTSLPADPVPLASGQVVISWPSDAPVDHLILPRDVGSTKTERNGFTYVAVDLPLDEPDEMPGDAPARFRLPLMAMAGNFASWQDVSAKMAPHFATEGLMAEDSGLMSEAARIANATSDPLERAALATRMVQDDVSYLLNGLDGGNYLPQSPAETWEKRFGDCKAKSLLLTSLLRELGIDAEPVLVRTDVGDAVPEMLPLPGIFNHMIVHARIDGTSYWLDGTTTGTRLANIADVPRFGYALPLRPGGADLVQLEARPKQAPEETISVILDQSEGITLPAIFEVKLTVTGANAALWQSVSQMEDGDARDGMVSRMVAAIIGPNQLVDKTLDFDEESAVATVVGKGIITTPWKLDNGKYETEIDFQLTQAFAFENDRTRAEWRDIPVNVNGLLYQTRTIKWLLPDEKDPFALKGQPQVDTVIGGTEIASSATLEGNVFELSEHMRSLVWEIPAAELPTAKRDTIRMQRALPRLEAPSEVRRNWHFTGKDRRLLAEYDRIYAQLISDADDDDAGPYINRASFLAGIGDFKGALADLDKAIELEASTRLYGARSDVRRQLGDLEGALADSEEVERLTADGGTHEYRVRLLGLMKRGEEALAVADDYALFAPDYESGELLRADAMGRAGQLAEGLTVLQELAEAEPDDGDTLNALCWYAGLWDLVDEDILRQCTKAVEIGNRSAAALDSRALALLRAGRLDEAIADLDDVLSISPNQHESRYLRGIVRQRAGVAGAADDIAEALVASPALEAVYRDYGLTPAR